ncbi:hypothetical protein AVEN_165664-1 [Araneus ventricosus]|uniref:Uncharacterized protein n=1 Tax=Araneus ventricosus TaxID=182803 RepID=A0A4Y2LMQ7_ARAVE|nr:hypothetical protein AVEN_165664-1 [Araneus ventricosus]
MDTLVRNQLLRIILSSELTFYSEDLVKTEIREPTEGDEGENGIRPILFHRKMITKCDFSSNMAVMSFVMNQLFVEFRDGCCDVDAFVEILQHVLKSCLNFSVQKPWSDEAATGKAEARALSKALASYYDNATGEK